jgi:hypothetical protein
MIRQTQVAGSRYNTGQRPWRSGSKEASSSPLTHVRLLEAMSVCCWRVHDAHSPLTVGTPASGSVKKVIEINPYLLGTMAGGAGASVPSVGCVVTASE